MREVISITPSGKKIVYHGFWKDFSPKEDFAFWERNLDAFDTRDEITILGPFLRGPNQVKLCIRRAFHGKWDYFITGESRSSARFLAHKSIGFREPAVGENGVIRFPYWKWYLTWDGFETSPQYERFGERLSISKLLLSINESHGTVSREEFDALPKRAVLITSHLKRYRGRLAKLCDQTIGCDIYGKAGMGFDGSKKALLSKFTFNLCPENRIGSGYVTEKIPEAFLSGCIPITHCRPEDLSKDFNPKAVLNLYGMSDDQISAELIEITENYSAFHKMRSEPLLHEAPSIDSLYNFLKSDNFGLNSP